MNTIITEAKQKDNVVDVRQVEVENKHELVGRIIPNKGHTIYEVDLNAKTFEPAKFEDQEVSFVKQIKKPESKGIGIQTYNDGSKKVVLGSLPFNPKVIIRKKGCIYISALNRKNLIKKLIKRGIVRIKADI